MRLSINIVCIGFIFISCSNDEKTIERVTNDREIAAYLRTISIENTTFFPDASENVFETILEVKDEQDGGLLEAVDVYISYIDKSPDNGVNTKPEVLLKTLDHDQFEIGVWDLPRSLLSISKAEALEAFDMTGTEIACKDQFLVRLDLRLSDGRSFTTGAASSKIIAFDDFWSSPFCYTINVVEPVENTEFTGMYTMTAISETVLPPAFGQEVQVEITAGQSANVREMRLRHRMSIAQEQPRIFRFTIACDHTVMGKNFLASKIAFCDRDPAILMGPDTLDAPADASDDAVFELWMVEGYLGFDGNCGFGTVPVRYRFSKQ